MISEKQIEEFITNKVKELGGLCLKWVSPGNRGVPDRIVIWRGMTIYVELKSPIGELSPLQQSWQRKLREQRVLTVVIGSVSQARAFSDLLVFEKARGPYEGDHDRIRRSLIQITKKHLTMSDDFYDYKLE